MLGGTSNLTGCNSIQVFLRRDDTILPPQLYYWVVRYKVSLELVATVSYYSVSRTVITLHQHGLMSMS